MHKTPEILPNPPLELVAAEVRYPYAPRLSRPEIVSALLDAVGHVAPIYDPERSQLDPSASSGRLSLRKDSPTFRFFDLDYTTAISVTPTSIGLETTSYRGFEALRDDVLTSFSSIKGLASVSLIRRVGLRYLNEIRMPYADINDVRDWRSWINPGLTGVGEAAGDLTPHSYEGVVRYSIGDHRWLICRFGALERGSIFREGVLRRRPTQNRGPVFILDFDAYCQPNREGAPALAEDSLGEVLEELHEPIERAFRSAVSEKLMSVFGGAR